MSRLSNIQQPRLPDQPQAYSLGAINQLLLALRQTFTPITALLNRLVGQDGGSYLESPTGFFYNTATQTAAAPNTAYAVDFDTDALTNRVTRSGTEITVARGGYYDVKFTGRFTKSTAGNASAWVWARVNGGDVAGTAVNVSVLGDNDRVNVSATFLLTLADSDYFEIVWAAADTDISMLSETAAAPLPATPSAILLVNYASIVG